jgi:hypothetical protein
MKRRSAILAALAALAACGRGDPSRSPVCGMAVVIGPTVIQQQLTNLRMIITDVPRGLPTTLPARVAAEPRQAPVTVGYANGRLVMEYQGSDYPSGVVSDSTGYALLVVDDTSQRVEGVILYQSARPRNYPQLGTLTASRQTMPVFGVRVDWAGVSNPRCPLLGTTPGATAAPPKQ